MDAFVSGDSVVLPSGSFAANPNSRSLDWDSGDGDSTPEGPSGSGSGLPGPQRDREAAMAERTSELISRYQDFISGTDEEAGGGRARDGGGGGGYPGAFEMQVSHEVTRMGH